MKNNKSKKIFFLGLLGFLIGIFVAIGILAFVANKRFNTGLASTDDRINLLLLGIGGSGHTAEDLTDTIVFVSLNRLSGDTLMLSLPRDIWVDSMRAKLNTAYHYGEEKEPGNGLNSTKLVISELLAQPIHYSVLVNFDDFVQIIDVLGGIEIVVEQAFDDDQYPIAGKENDDCDGDWTYQCRYEHLRFEVGSQLMDGERALKYVRSRHAENDQGSDFARSQRQQQVLGAISQKLFSSQMMTRPKKLINLVKFLNETIQTDAPQGHYLSLLRAVMKFRQESLRTEVLNGENGYLTSVSPSRKYDYHWVLVPTAEDWREVQAYIKKLLMAND